MFKIGDKVKRKLSNRGESFWQDCAPNGEIDGMFTVLKVSERSDPPSIWLKENSSFVCDSSRFELVEPKKYTIEEVVDALTKMCIVNGSVNEYVEAVEQHFKEKDEEYQLYLKLKAKYEDSK